MQSFAISAEALLLILKAERTGDDCDLRMSSGYQMGNAHLCRAAIVDRDRVHSNSVWQAVNIDDRWAGCEKSGGFGSYFIASPRCNQQNTFDALGAEQSDHVDFTRVIVFRIKDNQEISAFASGRFGPP